jgi:hypothetical protein
MMTGKPKVLEEESCPSDTLPTVNLTWTELGHGSILLTYSPKLCTCTAWILQTGQICCPETSVQSYHSTPRNIQEEGRSHLQGGGRMKSRIKVKNTQILCYMSHPLFLPRSSPPPIMMPGRLHGRV